MKSFLDVTAQWMIVNAVLNDTTIDAKMGQEWLSYKSPKARIKLTNKPTTKKFTVVRSEDHQLPKRLNIFHGLDFEDFDDLSSYTISKPTTNNFFPN